MAADGRLETVNRPIARYRSSRRYYAMALFALAGAVASGFASLRWPTASLAASLPAWIATGLLALSGVCVMVLALRPAIEIHETYLRIGRLAIPWNAIRRLDQTGWNAPLAVYLTLAGGRRVLMVHPGGPDSSSGLLRHLRRYSREALLDGIPYSEFWGEAPAAMKQAPPRARLLSAEDEEEVERMFQRLKTAGRLETNAEGRDSGDQ